MIATITGRGAFPIDMLRYDTCWPVSSEDASKIRRSIEDVPHRWSIRVTTSRRGFTDGRWESFGCGIEVEY